jgi:hypothetical protein
MITAMELPPPKLVMDLTRTHFDADASDECDKCGKPVPRHAAPERDDAEVVPLCTECEFGAD